MHGRARRALGQFEKSLGDLRRGAALAEQTGREHVLLILTVESAATLTELGRIAEAAAAAQDGVERARLAGNPRMLLWAHSALAAALLAAGDAAAAVRHGEQAAQEDTRPDFHAAAQPGWCLGAALTAAGRPDRAVPVMLAAFGGPRLPAVLPADRSAAAADLALLLALSPATISATVTRSEWIVLAAGTAAVIVVNLLLLRRVFGPLERLERVMSRIDPYEPGRRIREGRGDREIASVSRAFNAMLDRLERERTDGRRRTLRAQEAERGRVARELHDEVGQLLTGVVLQLEGLAAAVPASRRSDVVGIQDNVREGVQTVREIARGLRPPALEEFGLRASLVALGAGFGERAGLKVRHRIDPALPPLDAETELALYRVAQEAMTNVARHARAHEVELLLRAENHAVVLMVADDGCGISTSDLNSSHGVAGMRERALLVGGSLEIRRRAPRGTEVRLAVPLR